MIQIKLKLAKRRGAHAPCGTTYAALRGSPDGPARLLICLLKSTGSTPVGGQTRVRHILIPVDNFISPNEARARLMRIRERIEGGENFAELARVHAGDPVSSGRGGELGWLSPADTVRPFEQVMNRLEIGEVSNPVRTPFGMHLIQVLARRSEEMGTELARNNARQQIRTGKSDERYSRWLRQLRDESYIEYRREALSFLH